MPSLFSGGFLYKKNLAGIDWRYLSLRVSSSKNGKESMYINSIKALYRYTNIPCLVD